MKISPAIGLIGARQAFDQRRFARAVVAKKADNLTRIQIDGDMIDGLDAAEGDGDIAKFDKGCSTIGHFCFPHFDLPR